LPYARLADFIVRSLGIPGPYVLAMDRANWKIGTAEVNILMLSIVYRGVGVSIVLTVLPKVGASDTGERRLVMEIFLDLFGAPNIACLLGNREFVGRERFRFLKRHRIRFQMRLRRDTLARKGRGRYVQAWRPFCRTLINCPLVIPEARQMWAMELHLKRRLAAFQMNKGAALASSV
jgi:hypothetical protein